MIKHIFKTGKKDFAKNKTLTIINLTAIVLALVLITLASSWIYLSSSPTPPAENADRFMWINASVPSHDRVSVTSQHCEIINKASLNGFVWFFGSEFSFLTLNRNNKKVDYKIGSTDLNFWKALNFTFIKGNSFTEDQYKNREYVVVISDRFANAYFGSTDVLGKNVDYGKFRFKIQGVFKSINIKHYFAYDIFIPFSLIPEEYRANMPVNACFFANDKQGFNDLENFLKKYNQTAVGDNRPELSAVPYLNSMFDLNRNPEQKGALIVAFLLPILCFANLFTRKMELKIPEMAIKRAFGATRKIIFMNLLAENIFHIAIAGIVALLIAHPLIGFAFNSTGSDSIGTNFLSIRFYLFTILLFLLFGVLSAIRPAWKVSGKSFISTINQ